MPAKNALKEYVEGGHYHIYNRGVEKRKIFRDKQDYIVFLRFLKEYLLPPKHQSLIELEKITPRRKPINCYDDIELLAFCLLPNHFHLFVRQKSPEGLKPFTRALLSSYVKYFNTKYDRVGHLFQDRYKAVLIENDAYLLHITRYIHCNPRGLITKDSPLQKYSYSSYSNYLGERKYDWLNTNLILSLFKGKQKGSNSYQEFVEDYNPEKDLAEIEDLILEEIT